VFRKVIKIGIILIFVGLSIGIVFYQLVNNGFFGALPTADVLKQTKNQQSSEVFDVNGEVIGRFYIQDRNPVKYVQISKFVIDALVATEDRRFYDHQGVDFRSFARVFFRSILGGSNSGGGSTITQQLAKNLYPRKTYRALYFPINKTREIIIAGKLEEVFSKEEILELYLNTVSFGSNIYGIETAADIFFEKHATTLNVEEAATLVGMLKATTTYHPVLDPEASINRRNLVLSLMVEQLKISQSTFESAIENPMVTSLHWRTDNRSYYLTRVQNESQDIIKDYNKTHNTNLNLYTSGLKIITTLDAGLQSAAEMAVHAHMKSLQGVFDHHWNGTFWEAHGELLEKETKKIANSRSKEELNTKRDMYVYTPEGTELKRLSPVDSLKYYLQQLHAGFISIEPQSGRILAWVGGLNYQYFPYDHVDIHSKRQVGSIFKPIVYASALESGIDPCNYYNAQQVAYEDEDGVWNPGNADGNYDGEFTMAEALESSVNTVSVKILNDTGIKKTISLAESMGIESEIPEVPSIALGTPSISLLEMVTAYSVFVNGGRRVATYMIERIEDADGNTIYKDKRIVEDRALSRKTAKEMVHFLKNVVDNGTGSSLRWKYGLKNDIGGKTGTTQSNADGWFIAISPKMVTGVWVGGTYPAISFRDTRLGQGATMALPIVGEYYTEINYREYSLYTEAKFEPLSAEMALSLDCDPFEEELNFFQRLFGKKGSKKNKEDDPGKEKKRFIDKVKSIFKKKDKKSG